MLACWNKSMPQVPVSPGIPEMMQYGLKFQKKDHKISEALLSLGEG